MEKKTRGREKDVIYESRAARVLETAINYMFAQRTPELARLAALLKDQGALYTFVLRRVRVSRVLPTEVEETK